MFRIGQKVVCVDDSGSQGFLQNGEIYTVARCGPGTNSGATVYLVETWMNNGGEDPGFWTRRFRPIIERKTETGMAILREILERESHQDRVPERVRE